MLRVKRKGLFKRTSPIRIVLSIFFLVVFILGIINAWVYVASQEFLPLEWNLLVFAAIAIVNGIYYLFERLVPYNMKEIIPKLLASIFMGVVCSMPITAIIGMLLGIQYFNRTSNIIVFLISIPMTWYFFRKTNQLKNKKDNNEINGGQFKQHLQHTLDILSEYAIVVEKYSSENQFYMPESKLPHDKETVKYTIFTWHSLLSHIENREKIKKTSFGDTDYILSDKFYNWLETGYVLLAQFIPDMQAIFCSNYLNKVISFEGESSKSELNHKSRLYEKISKKVSMNRKAYLQEIKENRSKFKNSNV